MDTRGPRLETYGTEQKVESSSPPERGLKSLRPSRDVLDV